jgi:hypothetical protein
MKKFMEELAKAREVYNGETPEISPEVAEKFAAMKEQFKSLKKSKAWLRAGRASMKGTRYAEDRVVIIEEAYDTFVRVSYGYWGREYGGRIHTCLTYGSLICGDDVLEVRT